MEKITFTLVVAIFIFLNPKVGLCSRCGPKRNIDVSEHELRKLVMNDITPANSYAVKHGIKKITMNCTGNEPVLWVATVAMGYVGKVELKFHVQLANSSYTRRCYTSSITLEDFDVSITGVYYCTTSRLLYYGNENVHIFGKHGLVRHSPFLLSSEDIYMDSLDFINALENEHSFGGGFLGGSLKVVLPCALKYPRHVIVEYDDKGYLGRRIVNSTQMKDSHSYPCKGLFCVNFKSIFNEEDIPRIHDGFTITCKPADSNSSFDFVTIHGRPSPDLIVSPTERNMFLKVRIDQKLKFWCKSVSPVRIETNYKHQQNVFTRVVPEDYYKYQSEIEIYRPPIYAEKYKWWVSSNVNISCKNASGHILHNWLYLFSPSKYSSEIKEGVADNLKSLVKGECTCLDWESIIVYFLPCSTYTECQMKAPFLYEDELFKNIRRKLNLTKPDQYRQQLVFEIPANVSGILRCVGFQKDFSAIFYPNMNVGKTSHYPLSSEKLSRPQWESSYGTGQSVPLYSPIPIVSVNVSQIIEGEYVRAKCEIQLMLVLSHPVWVLILKNASELPISSSNLINSTTEIAAEIYTVSTTLKIPSTDIVAVACQINLLQTVSPIIWKNGLLQQTPNAITSEIKEGEATLEVIARPQELFSEDRSLTIVVGVIAGVFIVVISISFVWLYIQHKSLQNIVDRLTPEEIEYFRNGRPELISDNEMANHNAQNLAYDANREIPLNDLELDFKTILGSGEFGIVFKGLLKNEQSLCVAVKTVKAGANAHYVKSAMAELKVMLYIKNHENVVGVIGACTENLIDHQLYVVLEYCSAGDLLGYLRKNANNFVNEVSKGLHVKVDAQQRKHRKRKTITTSTLIHWAMQIANGMKYISSMNMIHGDLAARNILLDSNLSVKISDFGLSKKLYQYSNYIRKGNVPLPWRWLAVESLNLTEFSPASDVWAFGVTLWEIFSLGATPYPGQEYNAEFVKMLTNGFRLGLPEFSTYEIYNIIQDCWKKDPSERPSFSDIQRRFDSMTGIYTNL